MQLIPYNQDIQFNFTQVNAITLASIYLLTFTYHPIYSNFLYLLYGVGNRPYSKVYLVVRDSNTGRSVQNVTVGHNFTCYVDYEIKVTQYLFLVECQSYIGIYALNTSNQQVNPSPILNQSKPVGSFLTGIFRQADIFADKYVVFNLIDSTNRSVYFGALGLGTVYSTNFSINSERVVETGLSQNEIWAVLNPDAPLVYLYDCVACIYNGSIGNFTMSGITHILNLSYAIPGSFRFYQGKTLTNASIINGKVYWGFNSGYIAQKILLNQTNFSSIDLIFPAYAYNSTANQKYFFTYGLSNIINAYTFEEDEIEQVYQYNTVISQMKISEDSTVIAIKEMGNNWNIRQYQVVQNCSSDYNATENSPMFRNRTLVCVCNQYGGNIKCNQKRVASSPASSLPITAVIGVVAGLVLTVMSVIIIKKNYKRCTKGRRRTPWKYNPVDLMSFQT